ncbi:hypothetical protein E4T39_08679 [Aureobasidium subglaciale]|nr:hypothetical protein E4T39_08679 [Aureobasidium subglaciale]
MVPGSKTVKAYLLTYNFHLKDQRMVALLWHTGSGYHYFQKTDGTHSETISLHSNHICTKSHVASPETDEDLSDDASNNSSLTEFVSVNEEQNTESLIVRLPIPPVRPDLGQRPHPTTKVPPPSRSHVVVDLTEEDEDEPSPIKQEYPKLQEHPSMPASYFTPPATSAAPSEDHSFTKHFSPDPLAEEYGRITTQIFQEYSMRVFALPEVVELVNMMKQAVKDGDRSALCRVYGALQAFLITVQ